jgi:hypothetical protein
MSEEKPKVFIVPAAICRCVVPTGLCWAAGGPHYHSSAPDAPVCMEGKENWISLAEVQAHDGVIR